MHYIPVKDRSLPKAKDLLSYTVGFEDLIDRISKTTTSNYPPHNVYAVGDNQSVIELAVAGFSKEDITVETENSVLLVRGTKPVSKETERQYSHRGLSMRSFEQPFVLQNDAVVKSVSLENGLLTIVIERVIPNRHKKKVYSL